MGKRDEALSLARDFERDGFRVSSLYERFWRLQEDAAAYFTLADGLLCGRQEGGTLLKDAMGYVGEENFKALIATAVEILREEAAQGRETKQSKSAIQTEENARSDECTGKSARQRGRDEKSTRWKNAEEVIAAASLEFAPLLPPYLGELFKLQPNESAYYAEYPWRGLSYESSQIWRERLADPQTSKDDKQKIFSCLLQTRDPRNVKFACEFALAEDFFDRPCDLLEYIGYWLEAVGFTFERAKFYADGATQAAADEILKMDADECGGARQAQSSECNLSQMSNEPGGTTSASLQTDECDLSRKSLDEARDAASAVKFNAGELKSAASQNFKACAAEHGSKFNSNEPAADKLQKASNDEISFGGEKFRLKRYCGQRVYHIIFPRGYFGAPYAAHLAKHHPTWRFEGGEARYRLGGVLDEPGGDAQNPLFHLITLDPLPRDLPVRSLPRLILAAHVREINEGEIVFYEHDAQGMPRRIGGRTQVEYAFDEPIKECEVVLAPTPARWAAQDWGMSNSRQNLARIGGEPSWIQGALVPTCPICGEKMEFLMQLDSELPSCEQGGEVYFGSGGILYVFWCERTRVSGFFMQCT
ncbi:hypothetical protein [uncultured Campylobacter sp.]|uniref:hypothetical protein n=1 Tax=uncultured Campylobacter sp. TaxID=218934 RepID=UPI002638CBB6|nr:hypothetical protein [uncultured Campylobacter sp.]